MGSPHRSTAGTLAILLLVACSDPPPSGPATSAASPPPTASPPLTPTQPVITTGALRGVATFTGNPPEMRVPRTRKDADVCKSKPIPHNAVLVKDGKLKDVLVRLAPGTVMGIGRPPDKPLLLRAVDCMYEPRIQGGVTGQTIEIHMLDATLHNAHTYHGSETLWGQASPKGSPPIVKNLPDEPTLLKVTCDVHPWERAFIVVTDHPFFAVTGEDGACRIDNVPAGEHTVEAWHSQYGLLKREHITVTPGGEATVSFAYDASMPAPDINKGELTDLR